MGIVNMNSQRVGEGRRREGVVPHLRSLSHLGRDGRRLVAFGRIDTGTQTIDSGRGGRLLLGVNWIMHT